MKHLQLIFSVVFLFLLANCQLYDYCKMKSNSYKVKKFYEKNKNNEKIALFKDHYIEIDRGYICVVDGFRIQTNRTDTTVEFFLNSHLLKDEKSEFYGRKKDILEGEEKEEYLKLFREYKKLSVESIFGGSSYGYVQIEVIPDHIYLYVIDHDSFNLDEYIKKREPKNLKKIDDSWYYYYRHRPE